MHTELIKVEQYIDKKFEMELYKKILYISEKIIDFKIETDEEKIVSVEFSVDSDLTKRQLNEMFQLLLENDFSNRLTTEENVVWRSNHKAEKFHHGMFQRLIDKEMVFQHSRGQIAVGKLIIDLMNYLDRSIKQISVNTFGAKEYQYPTLISTEVMEKCGCFENFPQIIFFATFLHNDIYNYHNFLEEYKRNNKIPETLHGDYCRDASHCLPPTMCYHTYDQYADRILKDNEPVVVTSKGKSFRYESKYATTIERLWDFTIRETVFLGGSNFVTESRRAFMRQVFQLIDELQLNAFCATANDPFFLDEDIGSKSYFQKELQTKYELQVLVSPGNSISVGSFNYHGPFFGTNFNIRHRNGEYVQTACTGFGLERFAYSFLCQHGLDKENWPIDIN